MPRITTQADFLAFLNRDATRLDSDSDEDTYSRITANLAIAAEDIDDARHAVSVSHTSSALNNMEEAMMICGEAIALAHGYKLLGIRGRLSRPRHRVPRDLHRGVPARPGHLCSPLPGTPGHSQCDEVRPNSTRRGPTQAVPCRGGGLLYRVQGNAAPGTRRPPSERAPSLTRRRRRRRPKR